MSPDCLELYLRDPVLARHHLADNSQGRPLDDVLGCTCAQGTVVVVFPSNVGRRSLTPG